MTPVTLRPDGSRRNVLASGIVTFEEMEKALRQRLEPLPPAARAELLHVLMVRDFDPADRIGESGDTRRAASLPSC
jgi:hypothetical protein